MKIKKTLYNWLTNRFLLIIRNEENFAEKRTFSFNYAKLIVFGISFLVLVFLFTYSLLNTVFYYLNPEYRMHETNSKVVMLSGKVDSLVKEIERKDLYGKNLQLILSGQTEYLYGDSASKPTQRPSLKDIRLDSLSPADLKLREEMESRQGGVITVSQKRESEPENYFIAPSEGVVLQKFDVYNGNFGVEIATKSGGIVKAIAEGVVIFTSYSEDGYWVGVQHKNGFISIYKQNSRLLKSRGDFVNAGEGLAVAGETTGKAVRNSIYFELWKEGVAVNPENFISFN